MFRIPSLLLGAFSYISIASDDSIWHQEPLLSQSSPKRLLLSGDLIAFHKNLTQIESITYNEAEVGKWLSSSLESQGYTVEKQYAEDDRFNVFAYYGDTRQTKILVSSHIDTVSRQAMTTMIC